MFEQWPHKNTHKHTQTHTQTHTQAHTNTHTPSGVEPLPTGGRVHRARRGAGARQRQHGAGGAASVRPPQRGRRPEGRRAVRAGLQRRRSHGGVAIAIPRPCSDSGVLTVVSRRCTDGGLTAVY